MRSEQPGQRRSTEFWKDDAAGVAVPPWYAGVHCWQLRCERVLASAGKCADDGACCGLGWLRAGLERVVGIARGESRGGRCVQAIGSEQPGQRR